MTSQYKSGGKFGFLSHAFNLFQRLHDILKPIEYTAALPAVYWGKSSRLKKAKLHVISLAYREVVKALNFPKRCQSGSV